MEIKIRAAQASAQEIEVGGLITLSELRLTAKDVGVVAEPGGPVHIGEASATAVVTEATLNRVLARNPPEGIRDLDVKTLSGGRLQIEGKSVKGIPIPFRMIAIPEIEGGARLRLNVQQIHVFGPIRLFRVVEQGIENALNDKLAQSFDVAKLPFAVRLTDITVETGRLTLSGTTSLELRPPHQAVGQEIKRQAD